MNSCILPLYVMIYEDLLSPRTYLEDCKAFSFELEIKTYCAHLIIVEWWSFGAVVNGPMVLSPNWRFPCKSRVHLILFVFKRGVSC